MVVAGSWVAMAGGLAEVEGRGQGREPLPAAEFRPAFLTPAHPSKSATRTHHQLLVSLAR